MDSLNESETEPLRVNTRKGEERREGRGEKSGKLVCVYTIEREKIERFEEIVRVKDAGIEKIAGKTRKFRSKTAPRMIVLSTKRRNDDKQGVISHR